ncbi:YkgJ family cysteine cluster protein [Labilibacter marinus]|uniref:YkgJ family cysteine cluster protein n=1 Tax=Labilibacter marinus TaxID=1477105 RepID=UPI001300E1DE|nr:YkgJ family cysteine cluster protein [Labilibacter marinus]
MQSKGETNLTFYKDGYTIASREVTDFNSLTPLFKGMQSQYAAISQLTQSFAMRTHQQNKPIACHKGCAYCCYQPVYMTSQEALLIYEFILQAFDENQLKTLRSKTEKKLKKTKNLPEENKQKILHACPFLSDGSCSIYSVRPMACRIYLSASKDSCKKKYDNAGNKEIFPELFDFLLKAGKYMNEGFVGYLKGKGRKMEELTIEEFMVKLFKNPEFYKTWLTEDYFGEEETK